MGYVQEYGSGKFRGRKRIAGKMVSKSFASRSAAYAWVDEEPSHDRTDDGTVVPGLRVDPPTMRAGVTLGEFLDGGGHVIIHQRPSTQAFTLNLISAHIRPRWAAVGLSDITHRDVQEWVVKELTSPKRKPRTVQHIANLFKRIMDSAVKNNLIALNPATGVILPRAVDEEMRFLNTEQVNALALAMQDDVRAFVPLCAYTGLRIGEAFGLRWKRVDLFSGSVEVAEIVSEVNGHLLIGPPKTKAGHRTISIPRLVVNALRDHRTALEVEPDPDDYVFVGPTGPMRSNQFRRYRWRPAVERAGLTPLRPHDLRHTAVSMWIAAGASPKEVAVKAGHASVSFSFDRYGHLFPSEDAALTSRLDALIDRGVK